MSAYLDNFKESITNAAGFEQARFAGLVNQLKGDTLMLRDSIEKEDRKEKQAYLLLLSKLSSKLMLLWGH